MSCTFLSVRRKADSLIVSYTTKNPVPKWDEITRGTTQIRSAAPHLIRLNAARRSAYRRTLSRTTPMLKFTPRGGGTLTADDVRSLSRLCETLLTHTQRFWNYYHYYITFRASCQELFGRYGKAP